MLQLQGRIVYLCGVSPVVTQRVSAIAIKRGVYVQLRAKGARCPDKPHHRTVTGRVDIAVIDPSVCRGCTVGEPLTPTQT